MSDRRAPGSAPQDRIASGIALLFAPADTPRHIPVEQRIAQREALARDEALAAAHAESAQHIAELRQAWTNERIALEAAHAEAVAVAEATWRATVNALDEAMAEALAPLVLAVARALLAIEPPQQLVARLAAQAIAALPEGSAGTLRIAPGQPHPAVAGWAVVEDESLPPATVRAELDATHVTTSLAAQLEQMARELSA